MGRIEDKTCGRCTGKGTIEVYRHVVGGICFRCWGTGIDPRTIQQLRSWLERARSEYRSRRATLRTADELQRVGLARELSLIEKLGKQNRARLEKLEADVKIGRATAKRMAKNFQ